MSSLSALGLVLAGCRELPQVSRMGRSTLQILEMLDNLFHFHKPETESEANDWLLRFLVRYNGMQHRSEAHSRLEDWLANLPEEGLRAMCDWGRFFTFAREPERRLFGVDARIHIGSTQYEVDSDLAGETVILWWGLFDPELDVEHGERRYGPNTPVRGPIPLHRYRRFKKTRSEKRAERLEALAVRLELPRAALDGGAVNLSEGADRPAPQATPGQGDSGMTSQCVLNTAALAMPTDDPIPPVAQGAMSHVQS